MRHVEVGEEALVFEPDVIRNDRVYMRRTGAKVTRLTLGDLPSRHGRAGPHREVWTERRRSQQRA
jgi:hypothetical protein